MNLDLRIASLAQIVSIFNAILGASLFSSFDFAGQRLSLCREERGSLVDDFTRILRMERYLGVALVICVFLVHLIAVNSRYIVQFLFRFDLRECMCFAKCKLLARPMMLIFLTLMMIVSITNVYGLWRSLV